MRFVDLPALLLGAAVVASGCARPLPAEPNAPPAASHAAVANDSPSAAAQTVAAQDDCEPEMFPAKDPVAGPFVFEAEDGLFGFKDAQGEVVIPAQFQFAYPFFEQGGGAAVLANQFVFIDRTGKVLAQAFPYDNGPDYFAEGRARILRDDKVGFIDKRGSIVIEPHFDFAGPFCHGQAATCSGCTRVVQGEHASYEGGSWGSIDTAGRTIGERGVAPR